MSYGIASGPVIAGVLQGKSPMFDIWGKTVNLASRMQSTGVPGRIQVSDAFYRIIAAIPGQSYGFEESHETLCKGFGLVRGYFVQRTVEGPPEDLLETLQLEPNLGAFVYQNPVPNAKRGHPGKNAVAPSGASHLQTDRSGSRQLYPEVRRANDAVLFVDSEDC